MKISSKTTIMILSFIFDHNTILIHIIITTTYNCIASVRGILHMHPYIMFCSFLMENLAGIIIFGCQIIQDESLFYNTQHTVSILDRMNFLPSYMDADYFKLIWWTCLHVLIRNGCISSDHNKEGSTSPC